MSRQVIRWPPPALAPLDLADSTLAVQWLPSAGHHGANPATYTVAVRQVLPHSDWATEICGLQAGKVAIPVPATGGVFAARYRAEAVSAATDPVDTPVPVNTGPCGSPESRFRSTACWSAESLHCVLGPGAAAPPPWPLYERRQL